MNMEQYPSRSMNPLKNHLSLMKSPKRGSQQQDLGASYNLLDDVGSPLSQSASPDSQLGRDTAPPTCKPVKGPSLAHIKSLSRFSKRFQVPNLEHSSHHNKHSLHHETAPMDSELNHTVHLSPNISKFFKKSAHPFEFEKPGENSHSTLPTVALVEDDSEFDESDSSFFEYPLESSMERLDTYEHKEFTTTGHGSLHSLHRSEHGSLSSNLSVCSTPTRRITSLTDASLCPLTPSFSLPSNNNRRESTLVESTPTSQGPMHGTMWVQSPGKGAKMHLELNLTPSEHGSYQLTSSPCTSRSLGDIPLSPSIYPYATPPRPTKGGNSSVQCAAASSLQLRSSLHRQSSYTSGRRRHHRRATRRGSAS